MSAKVQNESNQYVAGFILANGREVIAKVIGIENGAYVLEMPAYFESTEDNKFRFSPLALSVGPNKDGRMTLNFNPQTAAFTFAVDQGIEATYRKQFFGEQDGPKILTMDKTIAKA